MRTAKLPNGLKIQFPDSMSDEEMDALVEKYIQSSEVSTQKYLLNNEALESMLQISAKVSVALEAMITVMAASTEQQGKIADILKEIAKDERTEGLQKTMDALNKASYSILVELKNINKQNNEANSIRSAAVKLIKEKE